MTRARSGIRSRAVALAVLAFGSSAAGAHGQGVPVGFLDEFEGHFRDSSSKLVSLARAMPAETYSWSPGEGVYSVARVYTHIAHYNYLYPDENLGRATPVGAAEYGRWEAQVTDKERVVEILEGSVAYVRSLTEEMREEDLGRRTNLYGRDVGEWAVLMQLLAHMNEHLGQAIAYARMNGIVPPWSN